MDSPPIVKGRVDAAPVKAPEVTKTPDRGVPAEVPIKPSGDELYATYDLDHANPYLADMFGIEALWNEPGLTYKTEVNTIDSYLMQEIKEKNLSNTTTAVKERLEKLEAQAGIDKTAPVELRVKLLAEHAKYLQKLNDVKLGVRFNAITK
jgi:hypothetical protein